MWEVVAANGSACMDRAQADRQTRPVVSLCDVTCGKYKSVDAHSNENMNRTTRKDIDPLNSFRHNELQHASLERQFGQLQC